MTVTYVHIHSTLFVLSFDNDIYAHTLPLPSTDAGWCTIQLVSGAFLIEDENIFRFCILVHGG